MKHFLHIITVLTIAVISTLPALASYPIVRNFPRSTHEGGSQNWAIASDKVGRLFFGNKYGLLVYDSDKWLLSGVTNGSTVRSLLLDEDNRRLYAGASEELGYFYGTGNGIVYTSLTPLLPSRLESIKEVWNIFRLSDGNIWFQADSYLFEYDGSSIKVFNTHDRITASAAINDRIYIATANGVVSEFNYGRLNELPNGELPHGAKVIQILPFPNSAMIVTDYDGVFTIDRGVIKRFAFEGDEFLKESQVFCAAQSGPEYAFGTVNNGVILHNIASGSTTYANIETGMQNNTVLSAHFDQDNNLWLGLDNGIDMVHVNSPYNTLLGSASRYGAGYASLKVGNLLYLGTNQGLYVMPYSERTSPTPPKLKMLANGQIWSITEINGNIYVCADAGLLEGNASKLNRVEGVPGAWCARSLPGHPGYMLVSTYEKFHLIKIDENGPRNLGPVEGYNNIGGRFEIDADNGDIWLAHWLSGVYRLRLDVDHRRFVSAEFFNSSKGIPPTRSVNLTLYNGKPLVSTDGGFSRLAANGLAFEPDTALNSLLNTPVAPMFHSSDSGDIWCITKDAITVVSRDRTGETTIDSISFSPIISNIIPGFENFNFVSNKRLLISMQEGFYDVNLNAEPREPNVRGVYFRRIQAYGDTIMDISPHENQGKSTEIPYGLNSLRVEAVMPEYSADKVVTYSFKLENYDLDWSEYSTNAGKEYTRLPGGTYTMRVRSLNSHTHRSAECSFTFTVRPPWYLSLPAKIVWMLCLLGIMCAAFRVMRIQSRKESRKMAEQKERELESMRRHAREESLMKDYEIAELKSRHLENDVQHKAEELSNITMNVVRKNEILLDISERLSKLDKNSLGGDTGRQITRIQALIKDNITRDDDWRHFISTFDAAYGNFTKFLQERHPGLTPTELRVCCYLIMGLNSKEIAQLFNITPRSVEMTRYRLRKKLGLAREIGLGDYLNSLFNESKNNSHPQE